MEMEARACGDREDDDETMIDYYDKDGTPLTLMEWAVKFEDNEYKRVAFDQIGDVEVSTVWLGLNHQYGDGPPLIFETMVFGGEHDAFQWRDSTVAEALETHAHALAKVTDR